MKLLRRLLAVQTTLSSALGDLSKVLSAYAMTPLPSSSSSSSQPLPVRVATYNVLSSHLADPRHFSTLNPDHLTAKNRLPVVLSKIDDEMSRNSVICLQEVSHDWAGSLHVHFANRGYNFVYGPYGKPFNGYMGVGIAYPTTPYKVLDVDIARLADKREGGWPKPAKEDLEEDVSVVTRIWKSCTKVASTVAKTARPYLEKLNIVSPLPIDPWEMSSNRWNILITLKLQDNVSGTNKQFAVSTYHMPCAYYAPMVMTIHVDLAARYVQQLCSSSNESSNMIPYVLAGDWNIKPDSSSYRLMTTGRMDVGDPDWPTPKHGVEWQPTAKPMRSAYAVVDPNGKEPDFTNYARIKEQEPFIETLDYIFMSSQWNVKGVKPLSSRTEAGGPFPNLEKDEPSDHVLIAADLELP